MAVIEYRIVRPVSLFDLVETLSDEEAADAVASHEGKRRLEKVQATERGELVEHQQQAVAPSLGGKVLGQAPPDLIEDQPDQGLGARDVGWRDNQIERDRVSPINKIRNPPIASSRHASDDRVAVETEERHGGRQHASTTACAFFQQNGRRP